jgi:hypothetical protein
MSTRPSLKPLLQALDASREAPSAATKLATVTGYNSTGVLVQFDSEASASTKRYKAMHPVFVGMRVLMLRAGGTWIIDGDVNSDPTWKAATLINGWANYSGSGWPLEYRRVDGIVWLRGIIVPTVSWNSSFWTCPTGPNGGGRPTNVHRHPCIQGGTDTTTTMDVPNSGAASFPSATATRGGVSVTYLVCDGQWPAEA